MFKITAESKRSNARTGILKAPKHTAETPFFMPVATKGSVKQLSAEDLTTIGVRTIISNALLLSLRPGTEVIRKFKDLHHYMNFDGMIFTDSGGFQMLNPTFLVKETDEGVTFKSPYDGRKIMLTPEDVMRIEEDIGSDVAMMLDNVPHHGASKHHVADCARKTTLWAQRCKKAHTSRTQLLFGITQGGVFKDLRTRSTKDIIAVDPDGIALGGLCIGETQQQMFDVITLSKRLIPKEKPIYLMGVGSPHDIIACVDMGIDIFDSRFPTRNARHGTLFTAKGNLLIMKREYSHDMNPIDAACKCVACTHYSRAYIHQQLRENEAVGMRLASIHNVHFVTNLMHEIRTSIKEGTFHTYKRDFLQSYNVSKERGPFAYKPMQAPSAPAKPRRRSPHNL